MKFKVLVFLVCSATTISAMEKPSWAQTLWKSTKDTFISLPLIQKELRARKQYQELRTEVEEIAKSGKTVEEVETKKIREQHQKVLQDFKKCACIPEQLWDYFLETFKKAKETNPIFDPNFKTPKNNVFDKNPFYQRISDTIIKKLRKRKLNPEAIEINIGLVDNEPNTAGEAAQAYFHGYHPTKNYLLINPDCITNNKKLSHVINHEITHLNEHHSSERKILRSIAKEEEKSDCFTKLSHVYENEADLLYALHNINSAKHGIEFHCLIDYNHRPRNPYDHTNLYPSFLWSSNPEYFNATDSHPSPQTQCQKLKRTLSMLEIEKELKKRNKASRVIGKNKIKDYKNLHFVFDPASNS